MTASMISENMISNSSPLAVSSILRWAKWNQVPKFPISPTPTPTPIPIPTSSSTNVSWSPGNSLHGRIFVFGKKPSSVTTGGMRVLKDVLHPWQWERCQGRESEAGSKVEGGTGHEIESEARSKKEVKVGRGKGSVCVTTRFEVRSGPIWVVNLWVVSRLCISPETVNDISLYSGARDSLGSMFTQVFSEGLSSMEVCFVDCHSDQVVGGLVGLEMGSYKYKNFKHLNLGPSLYLHKLGGEEVTEQEQKKALALGTSVNIARHLVNIPPSELNPQTYASSVESLFQEETSVEVVVWEPRALRKRGNGPVVGSGSRSDRKGLYGSYSV